MMGWFSKQREPPQREPPIFESASDDGVEPCDEELLRRFATAADDRAFEQLVARYGGMVLAVCRRTTGNVQDAEDAFQAAFMVLARKAASVRQAGSLPAWLHKTAFRVALRAKAWRKSRREQPLEDETMIAVESLRKIAVDFDESALDEELNRLPEKYRLPLFLCCVEGRTTEFAARQIGCSVGSVKGRLERGRNELRRRLALRRASIGAGLAALAGVTMSAVQASAVAPSLVAATVQAGMQFAAGRAALGYVSQNALSLANGSYSVMSLSTIKIAVFAVAGVGMLAWGGMQIPAPAIAGGDGAGEADGIVLQASIVPGDTAAKPAGVQVALADEPRREGAPRDGERPATGPRDGERPRAEGDRPAAEGERRSAEGERRAAEGERRPAEGERRPAEGERGPAREGARPNPLADFRPQTQREEVLYQMIVQLQREVAALREQAQTREGGRPEPRRDGEGEGERRPAVRDGERPATGPRDGERPATGPRDGERPATGPRDGERPAAAPPREGDRPAEPRKEGVK